MSFVAVARAGFGGTAKTAGHLAGALGTGLATLSMDSEYLKYRKDQEAPQHVLDGLMKGGVGSVSYTHLTLPTKA